jgi:hypothetical protein
MNKRIDFTIVGGLPLEQDTLDFMQQSYRGAFGALAKLCGDKVILTGVEVTGGSVSSGWIVVGGELIPFIGGTLATNVLVSEASAVSQALFEDGNSHDVYFTKTATCVAIGGFPFSDLVPLLSLQNVWVKDDLRMLYKPTGSYAAFVAANFDGGGLGLNAYKGWQLLSVQVPAAAGKMFVNVNSADTDFNATGKTGGAKTVALTAAQNGPHDHANRYTRSTPSSPGAAAAEKIEVESFSNGSDRALYLSGVALTGSSGTGAAHENMPPYFVVLTLIKL